MNLSGKTAEFNYLFLLNDRNEQNAWMGNDNKANEIINRILKISVSLI